MEFGHKRESCLLEPPEQNNDVDSGYHSRLWIMKKYKPIFYIRWGTCLGKTLDWYAYTAWTRGDLWQFNGYYIFRAQREFESTDRLGYGTPNY